MNYSNTVEAFPSLKRAPQRSLTGLRAHTGERAESGR